MNCASNRKCNACKICLGKNEKWVHKPNWLGPKYSYATGLSLELTGLQTRDIFTCMAMKKIHLPYMALLFLNLLV
jgi:hypothetical protein